MRTLLIAVLVGAAATVLGGAGKAQAQTMTWKFATLVAIDYWQQRGVVVPCVPQPRFLTPAEEAEINNSHESGYVYMLAGENCEVWISPTAEWHRTHGNGADYCDGIVHEIGHHAGHGHDYGEVMGDFGSSSPFGCRFPRQYAVLKGWRSPPRWVRRSSARVERLWLAGTVWRARVERARGK